MISLLQNTKFTNSQMLRSGLTSTLSQALHPTIRSLTAALTWGKFMSPIMFSFCTGNISPALNNQKHLLLSNHIKQQKTIQILNKKGIKQLFPIQAKTYQAIMEGKDVIAGDKTGSGKTIAFSLPVIERMRAAKQFNNIPGAEKGIKFLIMAPTRQLALQISSEVISLKHHMKEYRVMTAYGGVPVNIHVSELDKQPDIVVGTPGRVNDLINRGYMKLDQVKVVCIDEADYMFDIGFQDQIKKILDVAKANSKYQFQLLCFSATLNKLVNQITKTYMKADKVMIKENNDHNHVPSTILHRYLEVQNDSSKTKALIQLLKQLRKPDPKQDRQRMKRIIIFTATKSQADVLSVKLDTKKNRNERNVIVEDVENVNFSNVVLHGDIEQRVRITRLNQFRQNHVSILIASDVAARGLDLPNVDVVINYDMTKNVESYVHRAGRTGRAGKQGLCVSLISVTNETDGRILSQIVKTAKIQIKKFKSGNYKQANMEEIDDIKYSFKQEKIEPSMNELIIFDRQNYLSLESLQQELLSMEVDPSSLKEKKSRKDNSTFYTITPKDFDQQQKILSATFGERKNKFRISINESKKTSSLNRTQKPESSFDQQSNNEKSNKRQPFRKFDDRSKNKYRAQLSDLSDE